MVSVAKKIAMTAQDMVGKSTSNPSDLGSLANQLTRDYDLLAANSAGAAAASASSDVSVTLYIPNLLFDLVSFYIYPCQFYGNNVKLQ